MLTSAPKSLFVDWNCMSLNQLEFFDLIRGLPQCFIAEVGRLRKRKKKTTFAQRTTDWSPVDVLTRHSLQIQRERVDYKWAFQSFKVSPTGVLERWYNMPTDTLPAEIREGRLFCENKCANGTLNLSVVKANQQVSSMSFSTVMGHRCFKFATSFSCSTTCLLVLSSVESNFPKT